MIADMLELLESDEVRGDDQDDNENLIGQLPEELHREGAVASYISETDVKQYLKAKGVQRC